MAYQARVLNVMIASPGDVKEERTCVREIVAEWNTMHSEQRKLVLIPVGWETHASPEMGGRAQDVINTQVLRGADLLVAVFWTRLGTPTGESASGTVEEIEKHLEAGKPTMIYFSSKPVQLASVDQDQYQQLLQFREKCRERGLVEEYDSLDEFQEKFRRHLAQTVNRKFTEQPSEGTTGTQRWEDVFTPHAESARLSEAAIELLVAARNDPHGTILSTEGFNNPQLKTGDRVFSGQGDPRSAAKWRGALEELRRRGLVEDRYGKGAVFNVTDQGFQIADSLGSKDR